MGVKDENEVLNSGERKVGKSPLLAAPYGLGTKTVLFRSLSPDAIKPKKGSLQAAGFDLFSSADITVYPNTTECVPLGFATDMPNDIHGRIESRSGMAVKGIVVLTGVIDADYRGEWKVILRNVTKHPFDIAKGDRVAQVVFRQTVPVALEDVCELSESSRGAGGFGSTGN
jgi:deoxyuridine 5'-triphosphate nucleotidohydrolase